MKKYGKLLATVLLFAVSLAIFGLAIWRSLIVGGIESYVLLVIGAVCVVVWADEFIRRLRERRNERRMKDE